MYIPVIAPFLCVLLCVVRFPNWTLEFKVWVVNVIVKNIKILYNSNVLKDT